MKVIFLLDYELVDIIGKLLRIYGILLKSEVDARGCIAWKIHSSTTAKFGWREVQFVSCEVRSKPSGLVLHGIDKAQDRALPVCTPRHSNGDGGSQSQHKTRLGWAQIKIH